MPDVKVVDPTRRGVGVTAESAARSAFRFASSILNSKRKRLRLPHQIERRPVGLAENADLFEARRIPGVGILALKLACHLPQRASNANDLAVDSDADLVGGTSEVLGDAVGPRLEGEGRVQPPTSMRQ